MIYKYHAGFRARFFIGWIILFILAGCDQKPGINVLIVTFDTTRADHIAAYGNANAHTPNLDKLAQDSVLYEKALSPIPITLPSHSTIMTGKVPFSHGVRDNGLFKLNKSQLTLAEILKTNGFNTAAAIGSFPLTSQFGINQGFDFFNEHITQKFEDINGERTIPKDRLFFDERTASQVNDAILPWLKNNADSPFFIWAHYFDPHHPHEPPAPYNQSFIHNLYLGEIAYADENLGNILSELKRLKKYDNTLIVFTSDHGEGMDEHNEATHSLLIYNSTLHVPLIVKYPNQLYANTRIHSWVGLVDIFPTVLDQIGIIIPEDIQGHTLPTENKQTLPNTIYAESLSARFSHNWGEQRGLIKNGYKYIYGPQKELYNINKDPGEVKNLIKSKPELAKSMKVDLQNYIDEYQAPETTSSIDVDEQTLNTLRGLGYIQSNSNAIEYFEEKLDDTGDAPQSHVHTISTYSKAKNLLFQGDFILANQYLDALLAIDSNNITYLELKIQADINLGNYEKAIATIEKLPEDSYGTLNLPKRLGLLGKIYYLQKDYTSAKSYLEDAENIEKTSTGQNYLANIYAIQKNYPKQQLHLKNSLEISPDSVEILNELAISYAQDDNIFLAEQTFDNALTINPYHYLSYYNYGAFLSFIDDNLTAKKMFLRAIELNEKYVAAHYALIETQIKLGEVSSAKKALSKLIKIAPSHQLSTLASKRIKNL